MISAETLVHWEKGIEDFHHGRYWHAHEAWEHGWTRLEEPWRTHVQACIQVCGVLYHLERGRVDPARRLAIRSLELEAGLESNAGSKRPRPWIDCDAGFDLMREVASAALPWSAELCPLWLKKAQAIRLKIGYP